MCVLRNITLKTGCYGKLLFAALLMSFMGAANLSHAGINPFKKTKNYVFGDEVPWYENAGSAIKSGAVRNGTNTNYYHLNIDEHRMLLRLGKNDPSGELENTRLLSKLAITDVRVDGKRLPIFGWCLQNQQIPGKKLKQNAVVANDVCINAGGGDFVINLDKANRQLLSKARDLEFVVEPYGRAVKINYSMTGFRPILAKLIAPPPVKKVPVLMAEADVSKPKPKPKPKPKAQPKPIKAKTCYAKPPAEFSSAVKSVAYPCNNSARKQSAEIKIAARVEHEKKKMKAEMDAVKAQDVSTQKQNKNKQREIEWDKKQVELWVSRCQRHWSKGRSPCYCEKYLEHAPAGVENTCGK